MILLCDYYVIIMLLLCYYYVFIQPLYQNYYVRKQTTQYSHWSLAVPSPSTEPLVLIEVAFPHLFFPFRLNWENSFYTSGCFTIFARLIVIMLTCVTTCDQIVATLSRQLKSVRPSEKSNRATSKSVPPPVRSLLPYKQANQSDQKYLLHKIIRLHRKVH